MKKKYLYLIVLFAAFALIFSGCGGNEKTDPPAETGPSTEDDGIPDNAVLLGPFNAIEDDMRKGWNGGEAGGPGIDKLRNAKYLVLELGVLPADNIHLVFNGSVIGWTQIDNIWAGWDGGFPNEDLGAHLKGKTLTIDLSKALGTAKYTDFKNSNDWVSLTIFYSPGVDTLDIQRAYLLPAD